MRHRAVLVGALLLAGCGSTSNSVQTQATQEARSHPAPSHSFCSSPSEQYESACMMARTSCETGAKKKVEAYYRESGPSLEALAHRYVQEIGYSPREGELRGDNPSITGAEAGCLSALMGEYKALYAR